MDRLTVMPVFVRVVEAGDFSRAAGDLAMAQPTVKHVAGIATPKSTITEVHRTLVETLRYAADRLEKEGALLVVEPINRFYMPGFFLTHSARALDVIEETGASNLKLQYDVYHMQRMEGELTATIEKNLALSSARRLGVSLPNTATAQELFNSCVAHGGAAWDHSALARALEMMADFEIAKG